MQRLNGKVAIVTGGGSGIGRALAHGLAREGASVVVADIARERADEVTTQLGATGAQAIAAQTDVSQTADAEAMVATAIQHFGRVDILVNNAGRATQGLVAEMADEVWDSVIAVNLRGTFVCSRAAVREMIRQRSGRIINTASGLGVRGLAGGAAYGASKAAIINLTRSLAQEVAPYGITVNAIAPGPTDTPLWRAFRTEADIEESLKSGRVGQPDDFVPLVTFLCSEAGGMHTGMIFDREVYVAREQTQ